jgi:hypothetical protein
VALDSATYGRPVANGFVFDGSYTIHMVFTLMVHAHWHTFILYDLKPTIHSNCAIYF